MVANKISLRFVMSLILLIYMIFELRKLLVRLVRVCSVTHKHVPMSYKSAFALLHSTIYKSSKDFEVRRENIESALKR